MIQDMMMSQHKQVQNNTTQKHTEEKTMSNKETPVSWLVENTVMSKDIWYDEIETALQIEALKQQKYDEMLGMLESCVLALGQMGMKEPVGITQLIKEAQDL
jgi:hypothetical protein